MNRSMFTSGVTTVLSAIAAAALVACGGGNDDPAANPLTEAQAKSLAATTIHAVLTTDHVAKLVVAAGIARINPLGEDFIAVPVVECSTGHRQYMDVVHGDDGDLKAGDGFGTNFKACQINRTVSSLMLDGAADLRIAGGDNMGGMWNHGADGRVEWKLSANGMRMGGGTTLAGDWHFETTRSAGALTRLVRLPAATFGSRDMTSQFDGVSFAVNGTELHSLAGQVRTSVTGYGDVVATLSQASALQLDGAQTLRYAPRAGTVMLNAAGFRMAVVYGEQGVITLQVDQGNDNTVDLEVVTSVQELDALLRAPMPVADADRKLIVVPFSSP